jgi:hypothetical protein
VIVLAPKGLSDAVGFRVGLSRFHSTAGRASLPPPEDEGR